MLFVSAAGSKRQCLLQNEKWSVSHKHDMLSPWKPWGPKGISLLFSQRVVGQVWASSTLVCSISSFLCRVHPCMDNHTVNLVQYNVQTFRSITWIVDSMENGKGWVSSYWGAGGRSWSNKHTRVIILWIQSSTNSVVSLEQVSHLQNARRLLTVAHNALHVTSIKVMVKNGSHHSSYLYSATFADLVKPLSVKKGSGHIKP